MTTATIHPYGPEEMMVFCDGELSVAETQAVTEHIAECAECAEEVRQFREMSQTLAQWSVPSISQQVEESVEERVRGVVAREKVLGMAKRPSRASRRRWNPWIVGSASAAAAILLLVTGISMTHHIQLAKHVSERREYLAAAQSEALAGRQNATLDAKLESVEPSAPATSSMAADSYYSATRSRVDPALPPAIAPTAPLIARIVNFSIVAKDMKATRPALDSIMTRYHGYAAQMNVETPGDGSPSIQASLRIPVANLPAAMNDLRELGRVASESESGEDVTQQHQDLDQHLITARDTEERFRDILKQRTGNVSDVLQIEEGIARVRGEIESMEAEQAALNHRVDFAQVDLSVSEEYSANIGTGSAPLSTRLHNAFVEGYRNATGTVVGIFLFVIEYGLAILIWLAIVAVPLILLQRRYHKMRARL